MMKTVLFKTQFVALALSVLVGCQDSDYNLDELNKDISLGGENLTIKLGSSTKMTVGELLDLAEQPDVIVNSMGVLQFSDTKTLSTQSFSIPQIDVPELNASSSNSINTSLSYGVPSVQIPVSTQMSLGYDITMPDQVKALTNATLKEGTQFKLLIRATSAIEGFKLSATNLSVDLPSFFEFTDQSSQELNFSNVEFSKATDGSLFLEAALGVKAIVNSETFAGGVLSLTDLLNIEGELLASGSSEISGAVAMKLTYEIVVDKSTLMTLSGEFSPEVPQLEDKFVFELPDFMDSPSNVLDLENSSVDLNVASDTPLSLGAQVQLVPIIDGKENQDALVAQKITLTGSTDGSVRTTSYHITQSDNGNNNNISELVKYVPEAILVKLSAQADDAPSVITLGRNYIISSEMSVNVPFDFGSDFTVNYLVDNMELDLSDLDLKSPQIDFYITVDNTMPLQIQLKPTALGTDGAPLRDVKVSVDKPVDAAPNSGEVTSTQIAMSITDTSGDDALSKLQSLRLELVFKATQSKGEIVNLRPEQFMQFAKMYLSIPGGVVINVD